MILFKKNTIDAKFKYFDLIVIIKHDAGAITIICKNYKLDVPSDICKIKKK